MFIYKIVNIVNNKIYIGKTTLTLEERFKNHIKAYKRWLKDNRGGCSYLYNAFNKYGIDKFKIYELDTANTEDELNKKEIYWINTLNSRDSNIGYNIAEGGNGGWSGAHIWFNNLSEEEKVNRNNNIANKLKLVKHSSEWSSKISRSLKNHTVSKSTRDKLSRSKCGKIACYNKKLNKTVFLDKDNALKLDKDWILNTTGLKLSNDVKEKLRDQHLGMTYSREVNMKKGKSKYKFKIDSIESTDWHIIADYIKITYGVNIPTRYTLVKLCTTTTPFQYKRYRYLNFLVNKCDCSIVK